MPSRDIVVIGGSTGALEGIRTILSGLRPGFPAAIFVAVHTAPEGPGLMPEILGRAGSLPVSFPQDCDRLTPGQVYVAPPDRHLLVKRDHVRVTRGPRENRFRPAVDPLFRTASAAHGNRVIGILLSGGLDDGVVGLGLIRNHGGVTIVQDPDEALAPGMPEAAMQHLPVDHVLSSREIAPLLWELTREPVPSLEVEMADEPQDIAEVGGHLIHHAKDVGAPSPFTCPDCGGTLWQYQDGGLMQFQCHVGHRYSGDSLVSAQDDHLDQALWSGLRALEESAELRRRMARHARNRGMEAIATTYDEHAQESELRANVIRRVLMPERPDTAEIPEEPEPSVSRSGSQT
jgi:two-component system chemotaxis response regulator CheB